VKLASLGTRYESSVEQGRPDANVFDSLLGSITKLARTDGPLVTNAPATVYAGTFIDPATGRLVIHLVNYDYSYDAKSDSVRPTGPIRLHIRVPTGFSANSVTLFDPDTNSSRVLDASVSGEYLDVEIPSLTIWNLVLVGPRLKVSTVTTVTSTASVTPSSQTITRVTEVASPTYVSQTLLLASAAFTIIVAAAAYIKLRRKNSSH
jgi:hypothetical protein